MWKPPERVKHPIPEARWPTREEAAASLLFSPLRVGAVELEQRTWVPAMVPWRATEDGFVTEDVLAWYERFARGRPACSSSRRPASATSRAGRCCASATIASCPGSPSSCDGAARQRRPDAALHPGHRLPLHPPPARAGDLLPPLPQARATATAPPSPGLADEEVRASAARAERGQRGARGSPRPTRARGAALRLPRARHRPRPAAHRRAAAACCPASSPTPRRARGRRASTASSCTTRTPTRWRRFSPR